MDHHFVKNYLRRWWHVITLISIAHLVFTVVGTIENERIGVPFAVFLGPLILSFDFAKGLARPLALLPCARPQLIRTIWWLGIGLPTLWISLITFLGITISVIWEPRVLQPITAFTEAFAVYFGIFSLMYFALTGLPTNPKTAADQSGANVFFGALWGLSIGGSFLITMLLQKYTDFRGINIAALLIIGAGLAWVGYQRTGRMIDDRATGRAVGRPTSSPQSRGLFEVQSRLTGFKHFAHQSVLQVFIFTIMYTIFAAAFQGVFAAMSGVPISSGLTDTLGRAGLMQFTFLAIMPPVFLGLKMQALRVMRCLPLTAGQLTARILGTAITTVAMQSTIIYILLHFLGDAAIAFQVTAQFVAVSALALPMILVIVRFGFRPLTLMISMPALMILTTVGSLKPEYFYGPAGTTTALIIVGLTWLGLTRLIRTSSRAYRMPANPYLGSALESRA